MLIRLRLAALGRFLVQRPATAGVGVWALCTVVTLALGIGLSDAPLPSGWALAAIAAGFLLPFVLAHSSTGSENLARVVIVTALLLWVAAMLELRFGVLPLQAYGDAHWVETFVAEATPFPRWLVGSALAAWLYVGVWQFPPVAASLPAWLNTPHAFMVTVCASSMAAGTVALLLQWGDRFSVTLPILTPIWVLLSSGYVEYYPLITAAFVGFLIWSLGEPLRQRSPLTVGLLAGSLPLIYAGFGPPAALLLVSYALSNPRLGIKALGFALVTFAIMVSVCWPGGVITFLQSFKGNLNFGEQNLAFPRYWRHVASPTSIFFAARYVLARTHVRDLEYMWFWAAGWTTLLLFVLGLWYGIVRIWQTKGAVVRDERVWLGAGLILWNIFYMLFMIPRLGPTRDVDMFFSSYVTFAAVGGLLIDRQWMTLRSDDRARRRYLIICGVLASTIVCAIYLAWLGIPVRE